MLLKVLTVCLLLEIADGLMCYQCADSSSDEGRNQYGLMCYQCADSSSEEGRNQCQTYVRTMNYYRRDFIETGRLRKYVKNCTDFAGLSNDRIFCAVSSVESRGNYKFFNRGCTDGFDFFGKEYNDKFQGIIPDNQTTCHYNEQGYLGCVTMCADDFCNGPSAASGLAPMLLPVLVCLMVVMISSKLY